jgi:ribosome biogenesis protein BMS1
VDLTKRYLVNVLSSVIPSHIRSQAFAPRSGRRAERQGRRAAEKDQTRLHVPLVDRTPNDIPPPIIIAIVGPPGVGKTTLVKSLVRRYTKQTLNDIRGPVTVVSGKRRRLTLIESNNDLSSLIDIAKVADLILLMIDGSFGFEMVSFLSILPYNGVLYCYRKRLSSSISSKPMVSQKLSASLPI